MQKMNVFQTKLFIIIKIKKRYIYVMEITIKIKTAFNQSAFSHYGPQFLNKDQF